MRTRRVHNSALATIGALLSFSSFCGAITIEESRERLKLPEDVQVHPGDVITAKDADRVKNLISPGVHWLVSHGMGMKIIEHTPRPDPPAYAAATEKFHAQVRLTPEGLLDESTYVAGRPFPMIDPNDPQAAIKIMYNFERTQYFTDDLTSKLFDAETGQISGDGAHQEFRSERHFIFDSLRALKYIGRTEQAPLPAMPNPDKVLAKGGSYPIIEPFDLKGVGGLSYRYLDPKKYDDTFLYLPTLRRVRRLSTAQRSDALFGQDIDLDSVGGYAGQIPWFDWKLLAHRNGLAVGHGEHLPPAPCKEDGGMAFCDAWELGKGYVIEGTPKLSGYAYSKRIIYIDAESFLITYTDVYDHRGELWKTAVNYGRFDKKPNPKAALEYPFARTFLYGFVMVDVQSKHVTRAALPGMGFPDEPGWYVNQGSAMGVGEDWFTIAALIGSGV
jgi:hypothetical protein